MSPATNVFSVTEAAVTINGATPSDVVMTALVDIRVDAALGSPAQATLRFFDESFTLFDDTSLFQIGNEVTIAFNRQSGAVQSVFEGDIVAIGTDQSPNGLHELVLTCYDRGYRLARSSQLHTYQKQTYSDIVGTMAQRHGLSADVTATTITFEHVTQNTDDAAFLNQLCRRSGMHWRVEKKKLKVFAATVTAPVAILTWGDDLVRFRTRFSANEINDEVNVSGWDPASKQALAGTATATPTHLGSTALQTARKSSANKLGGSAKRSASRTVVTSGAEATALAKALRDSAATAEVVTKGETFGDPRLVPGTFVEIAGVGERLKGKYFITSVEHVYSPQGYVTRFTTGPTGASTLLDLVNSTGGGAGLSLTGPSQGLMIGIVTNNKDPDALGRVRVKFPAESNEEESAWARMATFMSGSSKGATFMPQIDAEVVVMFEGGDRRRPIVLGSLWNGVDKPPLTAEKFLKNNKVIQWQVCTEAGHTLTFDEGEPASANVTIALADGVTKLYVGKDKVELWANRKNLEVKSGDASLLLADGKDVTLQGMNVTIKATQSLKLEGMSVEITGKTTAKLEGQASVEVKGGSSAKVSASGIAEVAGSLVKIN